MSRLGRDYLKVGYYTEIFFVERDVRYIAINDGVDSAKGDNDFTPFRNLFKVLSSQELWLLWMMRKLEVFCLVMKNYLGLRQKPIPI